VNGVHLLFGDVALLVGFVGMGAPKDHEVALGLRELGVFLLGPPIRSLAFREGFGPCPVGRGCHQCSPSWWRSL
jgi:hypothetical protein